MKNRLHLILFALFFTQLSFADVQSGNRTRSPSLPNEILSLFPNGSSEVEMIGKLGPRMNDLCRVYFHKSSSGFVAYAHLTNSQGEVIDSRFFSKFQIGFGYDLKKLDSSGSNFKAVSFHKAEESYSSDTRSTLKVNRSANKTQSVQIVVESVGFWSKEQSNVTCLF